MATSTQSLGLASWSARYGDDKEDCADVGDDDDRGVDRNDFECLREIFMIYYIYYIIIQWVYKTLNIFIGRNLQPLIWQPGLCDLWSSLHLFADPDHREQLQQHLREVQDWGGDQGKEDEVLVGRC